MFYLATGYALRPPGISEGHSVRAPPAHIFHAKGAGPV